jgi:hypothetical protein
VPVDNDIIEAGVTPFIDPLSGSTPGTLKVRVASSGTYPGSAVTTLTLYPRGNAPSGLTYDSSTMTVSGMSSGMSYRVSGTADWINYTSTSGTLDVSEMLSSTELKSLEVRNDYILDSASASESAVITLSMLESAPELEIDFINELITGFEENVLYEYKTSSVGWSDSYAVALKADGTVWACHFPSEDKYSTLYAICAPKTCMPTSVIVYTPL